MADVIQFPTTRALMVQEDRRGALTWLTVTAPDETTADRIEALFVDTARIASRDGLTVSTKFNRRELHTARLGLETIGQELTASAKPAARGETTPVKIRVLIESRSHAEREAAAHPPTGYVLDGFGQGFVGREADGHLWGELVRYAYYVKN